jgi:hypothetical protein
MIWMNMKYATEKILTIMQESYIQCIYFCKPKYYWDAQMHKEDIQEQT